MERKRHENSNDTAHLTKFSKHKHPSIGSIGPFKWEDVTSENKFVLGSNKLNSKKVFLAIFFGYISVLGVTVVTTVATLRFMGITGLNNTHEKDCTLKECLNVPGYHGEETVKVQYLPFNEKERLTGEEEVPEDAMRGNLLITDEQKGINKTIGIKCEKGDKGDIGEKGPIGERGPAGTKGVHGDEGPKGEIGEKGFIGDSGPVGERGPVGKKGEDGVKGLTGDRGQIGDKGLTGEKGFYGEEGDIGEKGVRGEKGLPGAPGQNGTVGEKGQKGERADELTCDSGWQLFGKYCYFFSFTKKAWKDSQKDCVARGGNLVKIDSAVENWFLKSFLKDQNYQHVWIGASDIEKEGHFLWIADQSTVKDGFSNWVPGEPNNHAGREHCAHFWKPLGYRWNDARCSDKNGYICKKGTTIK